MSPCSKETVLRLTAYAFLKLAMEGKKLFRRRLRNCPLEVQLRQLMAEVVQQKAHDDAYDTEWSSEEVSDESDTEEMGRSSFSDAVLDDLEKKFQTSFAPCEARGQKRMRS